MGRTRHLRGGTVWLLACSGALGATFVGVNRSLAENPAHSQVRLATAHAADVETIDETLTLAVTKIEGNKIVSKGQPFKGGGISSFEVNLEKGLKAKAVFTITHKSGPHKGTIHGVGVGSFHVSGATTYFTGSIVSVHGTETSAGVKVISLKMSGTMNRRTYKVTATLKGKFIG